MALEEKQSADVNPFQELMSSHAPKTLIHRTDKHELALLKLTQQLGALHPPPPHPHPPASPGARSFVPLPFVLPCGILLLQNRVAFHVYRLSPPFMSVLAFPTSFAAFVDDLPHRKKGGLGEPHPNLNVQNEDQSHP
jgi:hypothetical protein